MPTTQKARNLKGKYTRNYKNWWMKPGHSSQCMESSQVIWVMSIYILNSHYNASSIINWKVKQKSIIAEHDQALNTRYLSKHVMMWCAADKFRMCHGQIENVTHFIIGCKTLAAEKYHNSHTSVAVQLHLDTSSHCNINTGISIIQINSLRMTLWQWYGIHRWEMIETHPKINFT